MAKATITSVIGEGQYAVRIEYDTEYLDDVIAALAQQLIDIQQPILDAQVDLIDLRAARVTAANALDDAIEEYTTALETNPTAADASPVTAATKTLAAAATAVDVQRLKVQKLTSQKLAIAARKTLLENNSGAQQPDAGSLVWCADYTTDISNGATVPIALIPGEVSGATWTILPQQHPDGYGATWDIESFGQLVPRMSMTPEATLYNWAMLPGWQRWMPTFRHATIESLDTDNDTCSIALETARSSANPWPYSAGLNVNLAESTTTRLTDVPVKYMTCNASAFEVGDRVLVRFKGVTSANAGPANWDQPEVIGFISNPRDCGVSVDVVILHDRSDSPGATTDRFQESGNIVTGLTTLNGYLRNGPPGSIGGYSGPIPGVANWGYYAYASSDTDYDSDLITDLQKSVDVVRTAMINSPIEGSGDSDSFDAAIAAVNAVTWRDDTTPSRRLVILITDWYTTGTAVSADVVNAYAGQDSQLGVIITRPVDQLTGGEVSRYTDIIALGGQFDAGSWFSEYAESFASIAYIMLKRFVPED